MLSIRDADIEHRVTLFYQSDRTTEGGENAIKEVVVSNKFGNKASAGHLIDFSGGACLLNNSIAHNDDRISHRECFLL